MCPPPLPPTFCPTKNISLCSAGKKKAFVPTVLGWLWRLFCGGGYLDGRDRADDHHEVCACDCACVVVWVVGCVGMLVFFFPLIFLCFCDTTFFF
jgi:hypothetical protein